MRKTMLHLLFLLLLVKSYAQRVYDQGYKYDFEVKNQIPVLGNADNLGLYGNTNLNNEASPITFYGAYNFINQLTNASIELEAYRAQYAFNPGSLPLSSSGRRPRSMNGINAFYIGALSKTDASGKNTSIYPHVQNMSMTLLKFITAVFAP